MKKFRAQAVPFFALLILGCVHASVPVRPPADVPPEYESGFVRRDPVFAQRMMVVSAEKLATEAGLRVLDEGGSAVDAAIAVQAMLTLTEPQSSGIAGGAFMLLWDNTQRKLVAYDGRETAPASMSPKALLDAEGRPLQFYDAVVGARAVGVPGVLRMLEQAHKTYGRLAWSRLFQRAIEQSKEGFPVNDRLFKQLDADPFLRHQSPANAYFYTPEGRPKPVGTLLKNLDLAEVLRLIAVHGADAFYTGDIAKSLVLAIQARNPPGAMTLADLAAYRPKTGEAVCLAYRGVDVCGVPPPSAGGVTTLQILGLLQAADAQAQTPSKDPMSPASLHRLLEAERLAYADRNRFVADPDFVEVPVRELLSPTYLKARATLIHSDASLGIAHPGAPSLAVRKGNSASPELPSTSHFVIADAEGNVVSMTTSIENVFGSRMMVRGFLLNNQLTDFSFMPTDETGAPVANAVAPGKRPRSSMSPIIVVDRKKGHPVLALGSPGGSRIIAFVAQSLTAVLDSGLGIDEAFALPHVLTLNGDVELERMDAVETARHNLPALQQALVKLGHKVQLAPLTSGSHGIQWMSDGRLMGAVDPRREGVAAGR